MADKAILAAQKNEITEHIIYLKLARIEKDANNKKVLQKIAADELKHYTFFKKYTKQEIKPDSSKIAKYFWISRILGITFGIKLMENGEKNAQMSYRQIPLAKAIIKDEEEHEKYLIGMINEERLQYTGSLVLGINDALVELTGALAGFTFALQKTSLIGFAGLVTGIAAALSMGASEYLSTKEEGNAKSPAKAAVYTGIIYLVTVLCLVLPYFIFKNVYFALFLTVLIVIIIVAMFTAYLSVAKDLPFKKRFWEMIIISMGVAAFTFLIGFLIRVFFNITI
jgi:VIT1/CCC1 family predicted Fe2+/Mn2+ transporter